MSASKNHKRQLLSEIADVLSKDDDFRHDEDGLEGPDYGRWDRARNELVAEFTRRSIAPKKKREASR